MMFANDPKKYKVRKLSIKGKISLTSCYCYKEDRKVHSFTG